MDCVNVKPIRCQPSDSEIAALAKQLSREIADVRMTALTPALLALLAKTERVLGARRQQVIAGRAALDRAAQANLSLQRLANHDSLTELHNRRSFDHALVRECNRASRLQTPVSLLIFDVDHFRALNNARGHVYGDQCLRVIAGIINDEASRSTDMAARIGGEEFAVLLPGATPAGAAALAEHIRDAVRKRNLEHGSSDLCDYVTVSAGVASVVPRQSMNPRLLLYAADQALYDAKRAGRNQVSRAGELDLAAQLRLEARLRETQLQVC